MILSLSTRTVDPGITVIELTGRITIGRESGQIESTILKALNEGAKKFILDVEKVSFIDSTGIGIVAYCFGKISQAGAAARVAGAHGIVMDVFKLTHLDNVLKFVPTVDEAVTSLNES